MKRMHRIQLAQLPTSFAQIAAFACDKVSNHIALLLGNLDAVNSGIKNQQMSDQEASLQQRLGSSISQWTTDWQAPKLVKRECSVQTWDIPHDYCHGEGDAANKTEVKEDIKVKKEHDDGKEDKEMEE